MMHSIVKIELPQGEGERCSRREAGQLSYKPAIEL